MKLLSIVRFLVSLLICRIYMFCSNLVKFHGGSCSLQRINISVFQFCFALSSSVFGAVSVTKGFVENIKNYNSEQYNSFDDDLLGKYIYFGNTESSPYEHRWIIIEKLAENVYSIHYAGTKLGTRGSAAGSNGYCFQKVDETNELYKRIQKYEASGGRDNVSGEYDPHYEQDGFYYLPLAHYTSNDPGQNPKAYFRYCRYRRALQQIGSNKYVWTGSYAGLSTMYNVYAVCYQDNAVTYSKKLANASDVYFAPMFNLDISNVTIADNGVVSPN